MLTLKFSNSINASKFANLQKRIKYKINKNRF